MNFYLSILGLTIKCGSKRCNDDDSLWSARQKKTLNVIWWAWKFVVLSYCPWKENWGRKYVEIINVQIYIFFTVIYFLCQISFLFAIAYSGTKEQDYLDSFKKVLLMLNFFNRLFDKEKTFSQWNLLTL